LSQWRRWRCLRPDPEQVEVYHTAADGRILVTLQTRQALAAAGVAPLGAWRPQAPPRAGGLSARAVATAAGIAPPMVAEPPVTPKVPVRARPVENRPVAGSGRSAPVALRAEPRELDDEAVKAMLKERGFFDKQWNPEGRFANDWVDNGDGSLSDRATGLMWQQGGSDKRMNYDEIPAYIERVNKEGLVGHHDWRLPTLEEAASLLEPEERNKDLYIDPLFDPKQQLIWTSDSKGSGVAWCVAFDVGRVLGYPRDFGGFVRLCRGRGL
jgi:hypothetical protein